MQLVTLMIEYSVSNWLGLEHERQSSFMGFSCLLASVTAGRGSCLVLFFKGRSQEQPKRLFFNVLQQQTRAP